MLKGLKECVREIVDRRLAEQNLWGCLRRVKAIRQNSY